MPLSATLARMAFAILSFLWLGAFPTFGASIGARLDRATVEVGDTLTLYLTFDGGGPQQAPVLPEVPNLKTAVSGQSHGTEILNGRIRTSSSYNYSLSPTRPGNYTIPPIEVELDGARVRSEPVTFQAVQGLTLASFLLTLPRTNLYVGETVVARLTLQLDPAVVELREFQMTPWAADGFTVGNMIQGEPGKLQISNRLFHTLPYRVPLTAVKSGPLTIAPAECTVVVGVGPFDGWGRASRLRRAITTTSPQTVNVLPLPETGRPATFSGAVGQFTLSYVAGPTNVSVGDPVTVRLQIAGTGSLESMMLPAQPSWKEFRAYQPTRVTNFFDPATLRGTNQFEWIVAPMDASVRELPPFEFSFFDPAAKHYRTLKQQPIPLQVTPAVGAEVTSQSLSSNRADVQPPRAELVHIKPQLGVVFSSTSPLVTRPWFLALNIAPAAAWLLALGWRKRQTHLERNPQLRRRQQVQKSSRAGLAELRHLAEHNEGEAFFARLFRLLQEQLGERLELPASAITEAVVEEQLQPRGLDAADTRQVQELFQRCNQARYAPHRTAEELHALVPKVEGTLRKLQDWSPARVA